MLCDIFPVISPNSSRFVTYTYDTLYYPIHCFRPGLPPKFIHDNAIKLNVL